jgi:hypothetical protein
MLVNLAHGLFLTCSQKSHYIYRSFIAIFTRHTTFPPNLTYFISIGNPALLTWRTSFFAHGDKYPSNLVSGLPTTAPPIALPLSPFHTPQFKIHYLHRRHQQAQSSSSGDNMVTIYGFVSSCHLYIYVCTLLYSASVCNVILQKAARHWINVFLHFFGLYLELNAFKS